MKPTEPITCHSELAEESFTFKILRLFAVANFATQTTQDDNINSVGKPRNFISPLYLPDIPYILNPIP